MRTDEGPVLGSGWVHLLATLVLAGGIVAVVMLWQIDREKGWIILGASAIPWAINIFRYRRLRRALGHAELTVDDNLALGLSVTATYERPLRGAEVRSIEARLQCEEEILKGSGKNKREVHKVIYDEVLSTMVTPAMERLEVRIPLKIPATGPATMWCPTANIKWWIRLRLQMSGCPDTASSFDISVVPAVVER